MLVAVVVAVCNLLLEVGSLLAKVDNQLVVVCSLADSLCFEVRRHFLVACLFVEVDNHLVEADNLLGHVGFLLVEVESGLVAVDNHDNQLVLEGLSIVVVFPPFLLCDERFPF